MQIPSLAILLWCWYWQAQLPVEEGPGYYLLTLPNHQRYRVWELPESWRYSAEVTNLHPATFATEPLWAETTNLEWRRYGGFYRLTLWGKKPTHYDLPVEQLPQTDHLEFSWLFRQGYRIEERHGLELLVHTPRGAIRQVRDQECTCERPGMCVHKRLSLYYAQYRPLLRRYPGLAFKSPLAGAVSAEVASCPPAVPDRG